MRIEIVKPRPRGFGLRPSDGGGSVENLPLQIGQIDQVGIHNADGADAGSREVERRRRSETSRPHQQDPGARETLLSREADLAQRQMARVTNQLGRGERLSPPRERSIPARGRRAGP